MTTLVPISSALGDRPAPVLETLLGHTPPGWMVLAWDVTLVMAVFLGMVSTIGFIAIWGERKVAGRIQHRHGPNRVGPLGLLQSLADGIKLVSKEDLLPARADAVLFFVAPYLAFAPVFVAFMALPFGPDWVFERRLSVSLLWVLAVLGVEVIGVILAGWSSNNKWSVYGAMREACQLISYEIPLGLSMLVVVLTVGTLDLVRLSSVQANGLTDWLAFRQPFTALACGVFFVASLASNKRAPFDLPESDSELVGGYHTEYSGLRFSLFFLAEYCAMFVMSAVLIVLFLGGWADPFGAIARGHARALADGGRWLPLVWNAAAAGVFTGKVGLVMFVQMWVRWTLPRPRIDQVLHTCVKVMNPLALALLLGSAVWELVVTHGSAAGRLTRTLLAAGGVAFAVAVLGVIATAFAQAGATSDASALPGRRAGGDRVAPLFYTFAALTLVGVYGVVAARHIVRAAVSLLLALLGVAGLYFLLDAEFLAAAQLVIYVGGTLVLMIFGVMLTSNLGTRLLYVTRGETVVVVLAAACLLTALIVAVCKTTFASISTAADADPAGQLGRALLSDYLVPFEVASVLMLAVMIGAAYLARRRPKESA